MQYLLHLFVYICAHYVKVCCRFNVIRLPFEYKVRHTISSSGLLGCVAL